MRLSELTGYKTDDNYKTFKSMLNPNLDFIGRMGALENFAGYLQNKGFKTLGSGAFGSVFTHPGLDYCIKVFPNDKAYMAFVQYCLKNNDNEHLPKFRGKFMSLGQGQYAVRMEILHKNMTNEEFQFIYLLKRIQLDPQFMIACLEHLDSLKHEAEHYDLYDALDIIEKQPSLVNTLLDICRYAKGRCRTDFHMGNFMKRGNTLVITDPFAET